MNHPFKFGSVVADSFFTNRKKELEFVTKILESSNRFVWRDGFEKDEESVAERLILKKNDSRKETTYSESFYMEDSCLYNYRPYRLDYNRKNGIGNVNRSIGRNN